jgi:hypothetical protein
MIKSFASSDLSLARNFFQGNREHHEALHASEISSLSSITSVSHVRLNPLSQRFLSVYIGSSAVFRLARLTPGAGLKNTPCQCLATRMTCCSSG